MCFLCRLVCSWDKILPFLSSCKVHKRLGRSDPSSTSSPALFAMKRKIMCCHSSYSLAHMSGKKGSPKKLCSSNSTWLPLAIKPSCGRGWKDSQALRAGQVYVPLCPCTQAWDVFSFQWSFSSVYLILKLDHMPLSMKIFFLHFSDLFMEQSISFGI